MSTTTIIVIVAIAAVVILALRAMGESRPDSSGGMDYTTPDPSAKKTPQGAEIRKIAELISQGRKIEAIKAYRDATGVDLAEAKDAVERYDPLMKHMGVPVTAAGVFEGWTADDWSQIDELLEAGNKLEAIRLFREKTGCDLKEAKEAIDIRDTV